MRSCGKARDGLLSALACRDASHKEFEKLGLSPSTIEDGRIHRSFTISDPSGYEITVNSTHVSDLPV